MKTKIQIQAEIKKLCACGYKDKKKTQLNYEEMANLYGTKGAISSFSPEFMCGYLRGLKYAYEEEMSEKELQDNWSAIYNHNKITKDLIGERNAYGFVLDWKRPSIKYKYNG